MTETAHNLIIRPFAETDSVDKLTELLHRAYKSLADMGLKFLATHQDAGTTLKRISRGECFVGAIDGAIITTITFYMPAPSKVSSWYNRPDVGKIGQLAVEPEYQRQHMASQMMQFIEAHAARRGVAELACDTSEQATHLIEWYKRLGYRFIEYVQWDVTNYRSVVMSKTLKQS
jgi:ribosomal protein S18 acetylase RimI-like enzyme